MRILHKGIYAFSHWGFTQDGSKRSQLWRQSGEGRLVHIASSEERVHDMVLDISRETISNNKCELLVVRKRSSSRNTTQIWNFRQVSNCFTKIYIYIPHCSLFLDICLPHFRRED